MFLVDFAPLFFEQARYHIAGIYDGGEEAHGFGPFSYKEYLAIFRKNVISLISWRSFDMVITGEICVNM